MPRNLGKRKARKPLKYPPEMKLECLRLHEQDGLTYLQIADKFEMGFKARVVVGRLIYEARQSLGLRPARVLDSRPRNDPLIVRQEEPRKDGLVNAYIFSQKLETPYRLARSQGERGSRMFKGMYYSIVRECTELKELPSGTIIETAWDYSEPLVRACAERYDVYPHHVKTIYVSDEGESLDDYYCISKRSMLG